MEAGQLVHAHTSLIADLLLDSNYSYLFSLGAKDGTLVQWRVFFLSEKIEMMYLL